MQRLFGAQHPSQGKTGFILLSICFFLSGLAGLIYQTAWTRQFAFVFGTSELAVATVLASYMGGLAAGAAVAARLAPRIRRPVLAYGLLELGIALTAIWAVPAGIQLAQALHVALFGSSEGLADTGQLGVALFYTACSFLIVMLPTGLMGATLPLLARHLVQRESEIGSRIGALYAINTVGAVVGTLTAGFLLLPALGLARTIWVAAVGNALAFAGAALLARRAPLEAVEAAERPAEFSPRHSWILPLILLSGAVSFSYEVLWTRLLTQLLGGSVYAFATMLASFLTGISIGSWVASRFATHPARAGLGFGAVQLGAAGLSLLAFWLLDWLPDLARAIGANQASRLASDGILAALTLLPGALCIGATFPFAVRLLARSARDASAASARVYAWNTTGAILGALGAGFFLIPALGFAGTLTLAVAVNLLLALAASFLFASAREPAGRRIAIGALIGLSLLALARPEPPWKLLRASPITLAQIEGEVVYYGVGRSATVLLVAVEESWRLRTNGLPEATIQQRGDRSDRPWQARWLGALPSLLRPSARSMLVVGLGGGVVLEEIPESIEAIDVIELEPEVIAANRVLSGLRRSDPLADPRVRLIVNDARGALSLTRARYDAIVSQPSHPWTAGSSHLYTREFFELARDHLQPGGVLVQWIGLRVVDAPLLRTLVATLLDVFPHVQLYRPMRPGLLLVSSNRVLDPYQGFSGASGPIPAAAGELGLSSAEELAAVLALDVAGARQFAQGAALNTDDKNLLQMRSPGITRGRRSPSYLDQALARFDPLNQPGSGLDSVVLTRQLLARNDASRAQRVANSISDPAERAAARGLVALHSGDEKGGRYLLRQAIDLNGRLGEARVALVRASRSELLAEDAMTNALVSALEGGAAATVEGWRRQAQGDWEAVRNLEHRLSQVSPADPEFLDALRLRVGWRLDDGDSELARSALELLDAGLPAIPSSEDLLLRARVAAQAGIPIGALATLFELASRRAANVPGPVLREALTLLAALPETAAPPRELERERIRLASQLQQRLERKAKVPPGP